MSRRNPHLLARQENKSQNYTQGQISPQKLMENPSTQTHKPHLFFSDLSENYTNTIDSASISISKSLHPENFNSQPTQLTRHTIQHIPTIKFNTVPAHKRGELFIPSTSVADSILRRTKQTTNKTKHKRTMKKKTNRILLSTLTHHSINTVGNQSCRRELFDPG